MQIGEVAERTSLSLRTIRYYEEVGLVRPSARSQGGFRLYAEDDVERLRFVRRMKPLEFSLEEMRDLLEVLDALKGDLLSSPDRSSPDRKELLDRLSLHREIAESRIEQLRTQLDSAERFAEGLREHETRHLPGGSRRSQ